MNTIEYLSPDGLIKSPAFSQAITVSGAGKTIYIGGQNAVNENGETIGAGNIAAQTEQIMKNIDIILKSAGAIFENLIKLNIYIKQGEDVQKAFEASQKYMPKSGNPPLVTVLFVAGFGKPEYLLEVEGVAFISDNN